MILRVSIRTNIWPRFCGFSGDRTEFGIAESMAAPERPPARRSRQRASRLPFAPPMACIKPSSALAGSVVGLPLVSVAQVSGMVSPAAAIARTRDRDTTDIDISRSTGAPPGFGMPMPNGLLPIAWRWPPSAAIIGAVFDVIIDAIPARLARNR